MKSLSSAFRLKYSLAQRLNSCILWKDLSEAGTEFKAFEGQKLKVPGVCVCHV